MEWETPERSESGAITNTRCPAARSARARRKSPGEETPSSLVNKILMKLRFLFDYPRRPAAAARQGSLLGIPSAAFSLVEREDEAWRWEMAVSFVVERLAEIRRYWRAHAFVNVNIPNEAAGPRALVPAVPGIRCYNDRIEPFEAPGGGRYCFARAGKADAKPEAGSDWDVVLRNQAAISVVYIHPVTLEEIRGSREA
jgi:hypothetical protein